MRIKDDDFERNIRSRYANYMQRTATCFVEHGSPPRKTEVTFEHYNVYDVEFVLLSRSETKDDVRIFRPATLQELKKLIDSVLPPGSG